MPELEKGAVAEVVLAPECIQDANVRARLTGEVSIRILAKGSFVLFGVSPSMIGNLKAAGLIGPNQVPILSDYAYVEGKLDDNLFLQVRGDQEARLSPCACTIPVLERQAQSLNHAFTVISEAFETRRRSHSGNVFERVYAEVDSGKWQSLYELRLSAISKIQEGENQQASLFAENDKSA